MKPTEQNLKSPNANDIYALHPICNSTQHFVQHDAHIFQHKIQKSDTKSLVIVKHFHSKPKQSFFQNGIYLQQNDPHMHLLNYISKQQRHADIDTKHLFGVPCKHFELFRPFPVYFESYSP